MLVIDANNLAEVISPFKRSIKCEYSLPKRSGAVHHFAYLAQPERGAFMKFTGT